MSNLANIIKNIDPPIELTQMQYYNLSEQQKNNGLYYVRGGSGNKQIAATTFAEGYYGQDSNVQAELNNLDNTFDKIIDGPLRVNSAVFLDAPRDDVHTDGYGNFYHSGMWGVLNHDETIQSMRSGPSQGGRIFSRVKYDGSWNDKTLCFGVGDTFDGLYRGAGYVTNSSKTLKVTIPIRSCATTATVTDLTVSACHINGGYIYMKYGNSYISLQSNRSIWENSAQVYANSISSISATQRVCGITISINFVNALVTSTAGTTNVTTLTPAGIYITPTIVFS